MNFQGGNGWLNYAMCLIPFGLTFLPFIFTLIRFIMELFITGMISTTQSTNNSESSFRANVRRQLTNIDLLDEQQILQLLGDDDVYEELITSIVLIIVVFFLLFYYIKKSITERR